MRNDRNQSRGLNLRIPAEVTQQLIEKIQSLQSDDPKVAYLKSAFLTKFVSSDTDSPELRRERAIAKWLATEERNEETNDRLMDFDEEYNILPRVPIGRFVDWCRDFVTSIVGEVPPFDLLIGGFSGGASTSRSRISSHPAGKYHGLAHATARAIPLWEDLRPLMPGWPESELSVSTVPGNVMFTVPKNAEIDRVACKEPDVNMFMQRGLGIAIRQRLRTRGIDLLDQTRNQRLARKGSIDGSLSTLDLSSASDSLTVECVRLLLPMCWFTLLDALRCQVTIIDGAEHRNQMFASMGNGFTFELESLVFFTLVRATCYFRGVSGIVSVYGDDIICPTEVADYVVWVLKFFGFKTNVEKSFTTGPIRESCGGHYRLGYDITPFYLRAPLENVVDVIHAANQLRRWATIDTGNGVPSGILDPCVEDIWLWLVSYVPKCFWGGSDTSFKYQLVAHWPAEKRLHQLSRREDAGRGAYYFWLNATMARVCSSDGVQTSQRSVVTNLLRIKNVRNRTVPRLPSLWFSELERWASWSEG